MYLEIGLLDKLIESIYMHTVDRDSSVDIATSYGLNGPGIESQ